jgi:signal transduction histidine kinase
MFNGRDLPLDVEIFDGSIVNENTMIYDHDKIYRGHEKFSFEKIIKLYGKEFLVRFHPTHASKNKSVIKAPIIVFVIGISFSLLIFRIFGLTKKSQIELREALESREEFISIASHELKTPLTAIKLHTQMVKRNASKIEDPVARKKLYIDHIEHTEILSQRLERLVDDMLDISRIKTGRLSVFKELVDMNQIVNEVIIRLKDQFRVIPDATPIVNYGLNTTGIWDKHRIDQVVTNLLTNAIKYGEGKRIEVTTSSTPTTVKICVQDQGIGIAPEFHEKIFHRFERAGINSKGISGLGLGLYITQQIVFLHGGTIKVESRPGEGSTFIVELPKTG